MRRNIFRWIQRKFVEEGCVLPYWMIVLRYVFLPLDTLKYRVANMHYDFYTDTYNINGIKFSGLMMSDLASKSNGFRFTIVKRDNGVITLKQEKIDGESL